MNRIFKYKNYTFNVNISFNVKAERAMNGLTWHRVTISDMGSSNWHDTKEVLDMDVLEAIIELENKAIGYVDGKIDKSDLAVKLSDIGFV